MQVEALIDTGTGGAALRAQLLGPFSITRGALKAGPWQRPSARRLLQLVLVTPDRRIAREAASEALFPQLGRHEGARALAKAAAMARMGLATLGDDVARILLAERGLLRMDSSDLELDFEAHQGALSTALSMPPGLGRDDQLASALADKNILLEDEPYADWALRPREVLERLRQEARLVLARDRARGFGRSTAVDVAQAWEACFDHDPACQEAATALIRTYSAHGRVSSVAATYRRCRLALEDLGLRPTPALEQACLASCPAPPVAISRTGGPGEDRRLVSVVFAEVCVPLITERGDPEELREAVGGALAEVIAQAEAFGGTVTSVSGAGLVALFGAPEAHEDDPERALLAASRSVTGVARLGALSLRIGVETGPAVVGRISSSSGSHYGAVGKVVNVAGALQSAARPASVLAGPKTRAATAGLFEWGPREEVTIPGAPNSLTAAYLDHPKARPTSQVGRRRPVGAGPLIGRVAQMSSLKDALRDATVGRGGVVVLEGEPGLGKTRLVHECRKLFMAWAGAVSGRLPLWLEGRAASYASTRPYGLYQQLLSSWVGVAPEDDEEDAVAALRRSLRATFGDKIDEEHVDLLSRLMGFGQADARQALKLGPEHLQRAIFNAVIALLSRLRSYGPTTVVLEDLHWADPTSLHLTREVSALAKDGPFLLVLTYRPEPDPGVSALDADLEIQPGIKFRKLELSPLAPEDERGLAFALLGQATDKAIAAVSTGAEGNPLFLEERLASLFDAHALVKSPRGWDLDVATPPELPEAIERIVRSRVDRLSPNERDAIIAASVLGPDFTLSSLGAATDLDGGLRSAVSELCSAGLLVELSSLPEPTFRFRHALIQEAIYKGLVKNKRRRLHARAGWGLEEISAGHLEDVASVLGHHYAEAGETERAVRYLELAGDYAARVFANDEAIASYRRALEQLDATTDDSRVRQVELWLKLGWVAIRAGLDYEARDAFSQGITVVPAGQELLAAKCFLGLAEFEGGDRGSDEKAFAAFDAAVELLEHSPERKRSTNDWVETWLDVGLRRSWLHEVRGEYALESGVLARLRPFLEAAGPEQRLDFKMRVVCHRVRVNGFVFDTNDVADYRAIWDGIVEADLQNKMSMFRFLLGWALLCHGDVDAAAAELQGAIETARRIGARDSMLMCLTWLAWARLRQHDLAAVRELTSQIEELSHDDSGTVETIGIVAIMTTAMSSWLAWQERRFSECQRLAEEALERWRPWVMRYPMSWICLWPLVAALLATEQIGDAVTAAREMLEPPQMRLPAELDEALTVSVSAWESGTHLLARCHLEQALQLAERLKFI